MDKKILLHIDDEQRRLAVSKIIDTINLASAHCEAKFTHFLDPAAIYFVKNNIHEDADVNITFCGGYDGAEREIMCAAPEWDSVSNDIFPIKCIKATPSHFDTPTHRDYLGALMGLGIEREQLGDIVMADGCGYIFCKSEMADYILQNLDKVGRGGVRLCMLDNFSEVRENREEKLIKISVASFRLDCVLSGALNISRAAGADLVKSCKVKVNFEECMNLSKILSCGDLISVRGFGRLKISEEGGETRKGRRVIFIKRYI